MELVGYINMFNDIPGYQEALERGMWYLMYMLLRLTIGGGGEQHVYHCRLPVLSVL